MKKTIAIILILITTGIGLVAWQQPEPDKKITVELELKKWNVVLAALAELPYREAAPLMAEIQQQAAKQLQPEKK